MTNERNPRAQCENARFVSHCFLLASIPRLLLRLDLLLNRFYGRRSTILDVMTAASVGSKEEGLRVQ
jgi:hypothetical protein